MGIATYWTCARQDEGGRASPLTLQVERSVAALPADEPSELWAVVHIGTPPHARQERPPINVGLVIDTSSSMEGEAIAAARTAATQLIASLDDGDRLSVVTFDSSPRHVVPAVEIDDDSRAEALAAVARIVARGTTDLAGGLFLAVNDLEPLTAGGRVSRIVLLSDGVPNDAANVAYAGARAAELGITITSLGFGLDYDEALLEQLARSTGGTFAFLEHPEEIGPTFEAETRRLHGIVAKNLQLQLVAGPKTQLMHVDGVALGAGQRSWSLALGDLSEGEERVVAVRLAVQGHRAGTTAELLDAIVSSSDPVTGGPAEPSVAFVSAPVTADAQVLAQLAPERVQREVARAQTAELTLRALEASRNGDPDSSRRILADALPAAAESAQRLGDGKLAEQVRDMTALVTDLEAEPEPVAVSDAPAKRPADGVPRMGLSRGSAARRAHSNAMQNFQVRQIEL
jgi:Ca-activated chloride channel family protein